MIEQLLQWDTGLFKLVHLGTAHPVLDAILPIVRNKYTWIPLYLLMLVLAYRKMGRKTWGYLVLLLVGVTCADQFSAGLIKEWVQRLRPCNEPGLMDVIRYAGVDCGSGFSFISSHATNHMTLAVLFAWLVRTRYDRPGLARIFYLWAISIAYAQVYVGVHYPLDVLVGMLAGGLIGWVLLRIYLRISN